MSLAIIHSRSKQGIHAPAITIEVHLSNGLPCLNIVGMPETAVKESKDRVRSALLNSHFDFPARRITISLAPADIPKEGSRYDLPIALGILAASGQLPGDQLANFEFIGELALNGELRPVDGVLPTTIACGASAHTLIYPTGNDREAGLAKGTNSFPARHLLEVCAHLRGSAQLAHTQSEPQVEITESEMDMADIIGQQQARRALEIAASGQHNLLLSGPPGTGKTLLASRLPTILPPLLEAEALESASIHSVAGHGIPAYFYQPPFRSPHHTSSATALVGGGSVPKPGEISLAHNGVLFLDELPEFPRKVLEVLREPLESGQINLSRAKARITYPAQFMLVAAMNPCPCGYLGSERCRCTPDLVRRYRDRISGPLLDRIDLHLNVKPVSNELLLRPQQPGENSQTIRTRVTAARQIQRERQGKANAQLTSNQLKAFCTIGPAEQSLMERAMSKLNLSARGYHRVLKVARTIADLSQDENISSVHLTEALGYRFDT